MNQQLTLECKITEKENGKKLLTLLSERFAYHNVEVWRQMIKTGQVLLNGVTTQDDQLVNYGDRLTYHRTNHQEPLVSTEFETVVETPELLLVGKSAGTPVSQTGIIIYNTFANILRRHYGQDIHLLHRLDRETSGLLLCARNKEYCRLYQKELRKIMIDKYYLAIIRGRLEQPLINIEEPLATKGDSPIRCRMWYDTNGKSCKTIFHEVATNNNYSLVLAELITGRKHQIRAHLAHIGHPLVGDKIYDHEGKYYLKRISEKLTEKDYHELGAQNHTLHAWAARLKLPDQSPELYYSRIFSPDMKKYLDHFPGWERKAKALLQSLTENAGDFQTMG